MTAKDIYKTALSLLGYIDGPNFQRRAVSIVNKVYFELFIIFNSAEDFKPVGTLEEQINLPQAALSSAMPLGVASLLALGEGDGELQQYFALDYDRARKRFNKKENIKSVYEGCGINGNSENC